MLHLYYTGQLMMMHRNSRGMDLLRLRSVSISVLDIRDLRTSSLRIDPSTSGATPKLVSGGWSGLFTKSKFTSGPTLRVSTTIILAFSNYLHTHYIARATTKRHLAGDGL